MPCADGELCHQQDRTPQAPHGHVCQGGCGGRLHGNCGSMFDDHETKRICSTCVAKAGKRKATPAEGAGAGPSKRPKKTKGGSRKGSGSRARQQQGSDDEKTGRERRAPPAYDELSSHFGVLEAAAEESGNGDAAFYLTKAKMAMIAAHSAKRVRQADMREFFVT